MTGTFSERVRLSEMPEGAPGALAGASVLVRYDSVFANV